MPHALTAAALYLLALAPLPGFAAAPPPPRVLLLDAATSGAHIVAVGERGGIFLSTDQAKSWRPVPSPVQATLTAVSFAAEAGAGWAVGHEAVVIATTDGGRTWARQYQGENVEDSFLDVLALDARQILAVGAYGLFAESRDGGATWTRRKLGEDDFHFNRLSRGPSGTLYLAGERGTLLASTDQGATWNKLAAPYQGSFFGVLPLSDKTLLAYGLRGHVYRSTDAGATWAEIATPQPVLLATAARLDSQRILLAGQSRALFVSDDGGLTFTTAATPPMMAVAELLPLSDTSVLAVGENGPLHLSAPARRKGTP